VRVAALSGVALLVFGCATPRAPDVTSFAQLPGFEPNEEFVDDLDRKLAIMAEGSGELSTGERFYYIAYMTREEMPDPDPGTTRPYPLWGEMQALWKKRRVALDPAQYDMVILDARVFPGTPGSRTRRAVYVSERGHWKSDQEASTVFEGMPEQE